MGDESLFVHKDFTFCLLSAGFFLCILKVKRQIAFFYNMRSVRHSPYGQKTD